MSLLALYVAQAMHGPHPWQVYRQMKFTKVSDTAIRHRTYLLKRIRIKQSELLSISWHHEILQNKELLSESDRRIDGRYSCTPHSGGNA